MSAIRVLLADDHVIVRRGLHYLLERSPGFEVVGEAADGREAVKMAEELNPDVVVMDIAMPNLNGLDATAQIVKKNPAVGVVILSMYSDETYLVRALSAGAKGYLLKDATREDLFRAVVAVYRGESLIQPAVASRVLDRFVEMSRKTAPGETLSDREIEVLQLMARGAANKEIAAELFISESTVKTHIANIFQKLDVNDRTEAVTTALQKGIIQLQ